MRLMVDSHPRSFAESCMQNNKINYDFGCKTKRNYINIITTKTKYSRHSKHWLATAYPCRFSCSSNAFTRTTVHRRPFSALAEPAEDCLRKIVARYSVWFKSSSLRDTKCCCDGSIDIIWILTEWNVHYTKQSSSLLSIAHESSWPASPIFLGA